MTSELQFQAKSGLLREFFVRATTRMLGAACRWGLDAGWASGLWAIVVGLRAISSRCGSNTNPPNGDYQYFLTCSESLLICAWALRTWYSFQHICEIFFLFGLGLSCCVDGVSRCALPVIQTSHRALLIDVILHGKNVTAAGLQTWALLCAGHENHKFSFSREESTEARLAQSTHTSWLASRGWTVV